MTQPVDFQAAVQRAVDPQTLKLTMDLAAVCAELGIFLQGGEDDGRWVGLCPFHDDRETPNFSIYEVGDGTQRCGCFACDFGPSNDVFDLLRALRGYGFREALEEAQRLAAATGAGSVPRRVPERRPAADVTELVAGAKERARTDDLAIRSLLADRGVRVPASWLVAEFGLGVTMDGDGVVIPHCTRDGEPVAAKIRRSGSAPPWLPVAVTGSHLSELYGVWRAGEGALGPVVVVEGESDTWSVSYLLRGTGTLVLGLPSGAAARPRREWIDLLLESEGVTFLFDADDAGRTALKNWTGALGVARIAQLDEGEDPTSAGDERVMDALHRSRPVGLTLSPALIEGAHGGYVHAGDDKQLPVTNYVLRLTRTVSLPDDRGGSVYEVALPDGRVVALPSTELENEARMRRWSNQHGLAWYGGARDAQELLRILEAEGPFHPRVRGTDVVGWNGDAFVLPSETLGSRAWAYVRPTADVRVGEHVQLERGQWDRRVPLLLATLHEPEVIAPILGWVAAAPLRASVKAFPILAVVGTAGWGKSTLIREVLATFGFALNTSIDGSTPHAVRTFAAATNAIPVWFDEYRRDIRRQDTLATFEQLVRDAWESTSAHKGGLVDSQRAALTELPARAPLVVSGEDVFGETSHVERMVLIRITDAARVPGNPHRVALGALLDGEVSRDGFGRSYLEWLVEKRRVGELAAPPNLRDRPAHSRAIARWGYDLLTHFAAEVAGVELPAYADRRVAASHAERSARPLVLELMDECEGRLSRRGPVVWREGNDLCVRVRDFVQECRELGEKLPGGSRAVEQELTQRFDATPDRGAWGPFLRLRERGDS